ncbi:hypothetical protein CVT24_008800 [Panaeolus cyanescens]|uniref:Uncharacterized protein n=1 Tax=Panaeolus cyanescens TaxID=181874 RepID=A0A409VDP0_9AGAR|nr:hypothetical protein CVT24_008800 [Panaeolus cyanescens]
MRILSFFTSPNRSFTNHIALVYLTLLVIITSCPATFALRNVSYDDTQEAYFTYEGAGGWWRGYKGGMPPEMNTHKSTQAVYGYAYFNFTGVAVYYWAPLFNDDTIVDFSLDGGPSSSVSLRDPNSTPTTGSWVATQPSRVMFSLKDLENKYHTLKIFFDYHRSKGIVVDYFEVTTLDDGPSSTASNSPGGSSTSPYSTTQPLPSSSQTPVTNLSSITQDMNWEARYNSLNRSFKNIKIALAVISALFGVSLCFGLLCYLMWMRPLLKEKENKSGVEEGQKSSVSASNSKGVDKASASSSDSAASGSEDGSGKEDSATAKGSDGSAGNRKLKVDSVAPPVATFQTLNFLILGAQGLRNISFDDTDRSVITYSSSGNWIGGEGGKGLGTHTSSREWSAFALFNFTGVAVYYWAPLFGDTTIIDFSLDDGPSQSISLTDPDDPKGAWMVTKESAVRRSFVNLENKPHTLRISMDGARSTGIIVDYFEVTVDDDAPINGSGGSSNSPSTTSPSSSPSISSQTSNNVPSTTQDVNLRTKYDNLEKSYNNIRTALAVVSALFGLFICCTLMVALGGLQFLFPKKDQNGDSKPKADEATPASTTADTEKALNQKAAPVDHGPGSDAVSTKVMSIPPSYPDSGRAPMSTLDGSS